MANVKVHWSVLLLCQSSKKVEETAGYNRKMGAVTNVSILIYKVTQRIQFKLWISLLLVFGLTAFMSSHTIMNVPIIAEITEDAYRSGVTPYTVLNIVRRPKDEVREAACSELQLWYNLARSYSSRTMHNS